MTATRHALLALLVVVACKRSVMQGDATPDTKRYAADGLAFSYPETMTVLRGRKDMPFRTVIVRSERAFAMVGWTPHPVDTQKLREHALRFARNHVLERAVIDPGRSDAKVSRSIGGRAIEGVGVYGLSEGVMMVSEVYTLELADTSVMLLLFYSARSTKAERAMLDVVASSLGPDAR
jgi:hypothetical protein